MQSRDLTNNACDHNDECPGEWAISVWAAADLDEEEITAVSPIRNPKICVCTVEALRGAGHDVVPSDEFPHADLMLRDEPSELLWEELRETFGPPIENPNRYEGP